MARKVHRAKSFSYDLLADWRPYAVPPDQVRNVFGWTYQGTVTLEGVTGALACGFRCSLTTNPAELEHHSDVDHWLVTGTLRL